MKISLIQQSNYAAKKVPSFKRAFIKNVTRPVKPYVNEAEIVEDKFISNNYLDYFMKNSTTNVINTKAAASLSIRSTSQKREKELRQILLDIVEKFDKKYSGLLSIELSFDELIPIFEKSDDKTLEEVYKEACKNVGLKPNLGTFLAGAETHIYSNRKNKNGKAFVPVLLGIADIFNMHSPMEKINIVSLQKGYELLKKMFLNFNIRQ